MDGGHRYEREAIVRWLRSGKRTSPMTGARLESTWMVANFALRSSIDDFRARNEGNERVPRSPIDYDDMPDPPVDSPHNRIVDPWAPPPRKKTYAFSRSSSSSSGGGGGGGGGGAWRGAVL